MSDRTFAELKSRFAQSCILFGGSREASKNRFPGGSHGKESICNAGSPGHSNLWSGRSPGEGKDHPLHGSHGSVRSQGMDTTE